MSQTWELGLFLISEPGGEGQAEHAAEHVSVTRVAQRLEQAVPLLQQDPFLMMALSLDTVESRLLIRRNLHQNRAIFECAVECQRKNNFTDSLFPSCHHFGPRRANTSHYRSLVLCSVHRRDLERHNLEWHKLARHNLERHNLEWHSLECDIITNAT